MRNSLLLASSVSALMLIASPSLAQIAAGELTLGQAESAQIPAEGADYRIALRAGQRIEAVLTSDNFDAYLQLFKADDTETALAEDDDGLGDGTTNSRLRYTVGENGTYVLRASSLGFSDSGPASLVARTIEPLREPRVARISVGRSVNGRLTERSGEDEGGYRYDHYRLSMSAGQRIAIVLKSEDFDAVVAVGSRTNGVFRELDTNDDGPNDGLNSYLVFTAPAAGEYDIRARSVDASATGRYELRVDQGPPRPTAAPVAIGDVVTGKIDSNSPANNHRGHSVFYAFEGREGEPVEITMTADDFDAYLDVLDNVDKVLASDDDSAGDLNPRVVFTPPADGTYRIEARPLGSGSGDFELKLAAIAPPPPAVDLSIGQKLDGELSDDDASLGGDERYDTYRLLLAAGQRVQVIMRSSDFDTVLEIGKDAKVFEADAMDDDGLGEGTNSRLQFTPTTAGDYILRAKGFGQKARGAYELEVSDRGPEPQAGSLLVGATVRSSLSDNDNTHNANVFYDDYIFHAKADEKLRITMVASSFDAVVMVGQMRNGNFSELAQDDDGLSDTHARLNWTAPSEGQYVVRATSFAPNSTGSYTLTLERQP